MDLSYQDSSDENSNMTVVRDDDLIEAGPSRVMEIEHAYVVDENLNENAIAVSDGESEADLIMPIRKSKDPSPVWSPLVAGSSTHGTPVLRERGRAFH